MISYAWLELHTALDVAGGTALDMTSDTTLCVAWATASDEVGGTSLDMTIDTTVCVAWATVLDVAGDTSVDVTRDTFCLLVQHSHTPCR